MTTVYVGLGIAVAALIAMAVGVWVDYRRETRTWNADDEAEYRAVCVEEREAREFGRLRDNLWGER